MDIFIGIISELLLQVVGTVLTDVLAIRKTKVVSVVAASLFACLCAFAFAGITIALHPLPFIKEPGARLAAMVVLPPVNGVGVAWVGRQLASTGKLRSGFEYFAPAFVFSLVFGAIRFFAQQ